MEVCLLDDGTNMLQYNMLKLKKKQNYGDFHSKEKTGNPFITLHLLHCS